MRRLSSRAAHAGLAVVAFAAMAAAQPNPDRPTLGLYAGLNLATIDGKDVQKADYQAGFLAGFSARWHLGAHWGFQPAIEYSQKGVEITSSGTGGTSTANVHLNYVELPMLLRLQADKMQGATPYLLLGPSVAFKTSCNAKAKSGSVSISAKCSDFANVESLDFGAMFGVGTDFTAAGHSWTLAARYDLGLKQIAKDSDGKNRAFSFILGVTW